MFNLLLMLYFNQYKMEHVWFDRIILILILLNSLFLAMNDYEFRTPNGKTSWRNDLVTESELVFLLLFTLECTIKTIAMARRNEVRTKLTLSSYMPLPFSTSNRSRPRVLRRRSMISCLHWTSKWNNRR